MSSMSIGFFVRRPRDGLQGWLTGEAEILTMKTPSGLVMTRYPLAQGFERFRTPFRAFRPSRPGGGGWFLLWGAPSFLGGVGCFFLLLPGSGICSHAFLLCGTCV